jgi:fatty acid desaturase
MGSFLFGVFGWLIGALGHDGGHFAVGRSPTVNDAAVWGMSWLCNPVMWQHQHTYAHHSFTNDFEHDPDLHHFTTLLRVHRRFQQRNVYQYQSNWPYVFFAYTFVVFGTCFWIPWQVVADGSLYGLVEWTDQKRPFRAAGMYLHMAAYVSIIFILPFWTHGSVLRAMTGIWVHIATSGLLFAIFSQINHLNEPSLDEKQLALRDASRHALLKDSWAVTQIETSNNFATHSALWHILSNGLNLQIEHHLFPGLNHCHLHHIAPVVRMTCEEYGVCYKSYESWSDILQATLSWLDLLSLEPAP